MDVLSKQEEQFVRDEKRRLKSFQERDASVYFELCNKNGITPEDEDLYLRGQVDSEFIKRREPKLSKLSKKASGKTGISVKKINFEDARRIVDRYSKNDAYLKHLVSEYVPEDTRIPVDDMSYRELLHYGYVILGIAKKEVRKH